MMGGCLCGGVRYRLSALPNDVGWCHCRDCQLNSGSPAMPFANLAADTFQIVQGAEILKEYASSEFGRRHFCSTCGTPLLATDIREPDGLAISLATLDEPDAVSPTFHMYYASHIAWAPACDELPRFATTRKNGG